MNRKVYGQYNTQEHKKNIGWKSSTNELTYRENDEGVSLDGQVEGQTYRQTDRQMVDLTDE